MLRVSWIHPRISHARQHLRGEQRESTHHQGHADRVRLRHAVRPRPHEDPEPADDNHDLEGLQSLGAMNDTDDAFLFYAISQLSGPKPAWLSIRNASEPQIAASIPAGTSSSAVTRQLAGIAGRIYGIYQYCTTLNSAFACWAVVAGL